MMNDESFIAHRSAFIVQDHMTRPRRLKRRPNGTVVVAPSITLISSGQDAHIVQSLEQSANVAAVCAEALRRYFGAFKSVAPEDRFRKRKNGKLEITLTLEMWPERDGDLIAAIRNAPEGAVEAAVVEMMRNGGGKKVRKAEEAATGIDISGLGIDLD